MNGTDLEDRCLSFSVDIVNYVKNSPAHKSIVDQLLRSATSIGANYTEANNASSRLDFRNKIYIAKKEASETRYWLKLFQKTERNSTELENLLNECTQLILILQKIATTLNTKTAK